MTIFDDWIRSIVDSSEKTIVINGKAVKSATDKINRGNIAYIVSTF